MEQSNSIKDMLASLTDEERKKLMPDLSKDDFEALMRMSERKMLAFLKEYKPKIRSTVKDDLSVKTPCLKDRWFDKQCSGLSKDGEAHLKELTKQLANPATSHHVDRKQVRYLKQLKKMRLSVPDVFREKVDPKAFYQHLIDFCRHNDIPEEIVHRVVPALVSYLETGYMRPIIFVGEKGCGKTTAVRLLIEEALHLPTAIIKVPHSAGSHGMTGDCGVFQSADVGDLARERLRANSILVVYLVDEVDKEPLDRARVNIADELLSITDESCSDVYDKYLETTLVGLEHCPIFMTANDLDAVSPILADRCTVIRFPKANAERIKSIARKYAEKKLTSALYNMIEFDYELMDAHIENLVHHNVTSLRKHQQMIEAVLYSALDAAFSQEINAPVQVTEEMFVQAERTILDTLKKKAGF